MNIHLIKKIAFCSFLLSINSFSSAVATDTGSKLLLYPAPVIQETTPDQFSLNEKIIILFDKRSKINAEFLNTELRSIGINLQRSQIVRDPFKSNVIILCGKENVLLNSDVTTALGKEDAYYLSVTKEKILVTGADVGGQLYGILSLLQLIDKSRSAVKEVEILDWPKMTFRGLRGHFPKNNPQEIEQFKRIIKAMAFCRMNQFWIRDLYARRFPASIRWNLHPEISDLDAISKSLAKELIDYADRFNVEVMGSLASTADIVWSIYPHLIEMGPGESPHTVVIKKEKNRTLRYRFGSRFNLCPSQEETYRLLFDLIDEMAPLFTSNVFDLGIDEVGQPYNGSRWAADEFCLGRDPVELFSRYVNRLADYVSNKGKIPLVNSTPFIKEHGGAFHNIYKSLAHVRKNIIINNWSEGAVRRRYWIQKVRKFKSSEYFYSYGFDKIIHMTGYARRWIDRPELLESKGKTDCFGAIITHYKYITGKEGISENTLDDLAFSSNHFWTPDNPEMNSKMEESLVFYAKGVLSSILRGSSFLEAFSENNYH